MRQKECLTARGNTAPREIGEKFVGRYLVAFGVVSPGDTAVQRLESLSCKARNVIRMEQKHKRTTPRKMVQLRDLRKTVNF